LLDINYEVQETASLTALKNGAEGEEEIQGGEKDNASGEGKEEEEDEATVVDTEDEDSPPGGHCFRCRRLCSSAPELKTIRVDGKLRMFDQRCHGMFEAGIEHPTPPKFKGVEEKESSRKPTALMMGDVEATGQCEAMGEDCQWQELPITTECVSCNGTMQCMSCVERSLMMVKGWRMRFVTSATTATM